MLIGRGEERRLLAQLVAGARLGRSGVLLLTGEAGVGKTSLLEETAAAAEGFAVLRAVGSESEVEVPFGGLLQLLRPVLDELDAIPQVQSEALGAALALRPGVDAGRFAIGAAVLSLVCRVAERRPLLLAVDDLHLLDRPSVDALAFAARRLVADPVVVLATVRSEVVDDLDRTLPRLEVGPLGLDDARALLGAVREDALPETVVGDLHRATGGNPLALLELADEGAHLRGISPETPVPVSAALARTFVGRAAGLGPDARRVLLVAAVAGGDLLLTSAACALLGLDVDALAEAETARLVEVDADRIRWRHPLVRSAIHTSADPAERRRAHAAVAEALPAGADDRRAWHRADAALGPDEAVAGALESAGRSAAARTAHAVASAAFERAGRMSSGVPDRRRRLVLAAESAWLAGASPRSGALLDEAAAEVSTGDGVVVPVEVRRALELRGAIALHSGDLGAAVARSVALADLATSPEEAVGPLADAIHASFYRADAASALRLAERIESLDLAGAEPALRAVAEAAAGVGRAVANAGGTESLRRALAELDAAGDAGARGRRAPWLMVAPLFLRDDRAAAGVRAQLEPIRRELAVGVLPAVLFFLARDEATSDRWTEAEATYAESIRLARETGQGTHLLIAGAGLAWLLARTGRRAAHDAVVAEVGGIAEEGEVRLATMWLRYAAGDLALGSGDALGAIEAYTDLSRMLADTGFEDPDLSPAPDLVEALLRSGRAGEAADLAGSHLVAAEHKERPWALARARRAVALTAPDDRWREGFEAALEAHGRTVDGYETARTRLALGGRLRRARQRAASRPHLRSALERFEALGAAGWADIAAAELAATGETVRRASAAPSAALTPQELQVCVMLAEGRTTREVAAALYLSPKTVEYHLHKVYTRLGIRSRAELAGLLTRQGEVG